MSAFRARVDLSRLRAKLQRLPGELQAAAHSELETAAKALIEKVEGGSPIERRRRIIRQIDWQLDSVFIPVVLLHRRREQWPDLAAIYRARILAGQKTYRGRKRFFVDASKVAMLRATLIASALRREPGTLYRVRFLPTWNGRVRVEVIKRGSWRRGERNVLVTFARTKVRASAVTCLTIAIDRCGLRAL